MSPLPDGGTDVSGTAGLEIIARVGGRSGVA